MTPITDSTQVEHYRALVRKMMLSEEGKEYEFSPVFLRECEWKVVPVESAMRLATEDVPRIVSALKQAGCFQCIVVVNEAGYLQPIRPENELFDGGATCYLLSVEESEFMAFNRKLGPFRSILTDEAKSWAISCNESYNLFAGGRELVEALLGEPVEQARKKFLGFASMMAKGSPDEPLMQVATRYAAF